MAVMAGAMLLSMSLAHCAETLESLDAPSLSGEFTIGREGRLILLPVQIGQREYQFLVDTGACRSGIDIKLRSTLGDFRGRQLLQTPAGISDVDTYDWPVATLGGQRLRSRRPVACVDLSELRQASNTNLAGVVGMDVLMHTRIQIDFDRGRLRFLESMPTKTDELGSRIPLEITSEGAPHFRAVLADQSHERFLIDTGAHGNSIRTDRFDQLLDQGLIRLGSPFTSVSVGGEVQGHRGRIRKLTLGPYLHEELRTSRVNVSSLGLRYLSRFVVTLDFLEGVAYLRPGEHYSKGEPQATSGMALHWVNGEVTVKSAKESGPAAIAGIKPNDVLLQIDGLPARNYDHFMLRALLMYEVGRKVPLKVRRMNEVFTTELTLEED